MGLIYKSLADTINLKKFKVIIPGDYEPVIHPLHQSGYQPIFNEFNDPGISFIAIKDMIEMCFQGIEFTICNSGDVSYVCDILENYIASMQGYNQRSNVGIFLDRCVLTLQHLSKIERRVDRHETVYKRQQDILSMNHQME